MNDSELVQRLRSLETEIQPRPDFADSLFTTLRAQAVSRRAGFRMPQKLLAGAAVGVVAVVVAGVGFALLGGRLPGPGPMSSPVPTQLLTASPNASGEVRLVSGTTYGSLSFSEPFHFLMPDIYPSVDDQNLIQAVMTEWGSSHALQLSNDCCWRVWFLDDLPVNNDVCEWFRGKRAGVPATPEEVGEWLRDGSWMTVSEPVEIPVDGRTALRFDLEPETGCDPFQAPLTPPDVMYDLQVYAIPTGDDTIILVSSSDRESETFVKRGAEFLVLSMTFDAE